MKKKIILLAVTFVAAISLQLILLYASAFIPKSAIEEHFRESADILCEKSVFFDVNEGVRMTRIDRYADSILLNIAWNLEPSLKSVMRTSYHYSEFENENDNLHDAVYNGDPANQEYVRYWHGSAAIVRMMHVFFNIRQIYIFHAVVLSVLVIILLTILLARKMYAEAAAFVIGLISVGSWYVPLSLEYTWTFICMLVFSITVLLYAKIPEKITADKNTGLLIIFLLSGMITVYLDFLSAETIAMTVPLLFLYRVYLRNTKPHTDRSYLTSLGSMCLIWGAGYVISWVMKWILASVITGENVLPLVSGHVSERLNGGVSGITALPGYIVQTVWKNLSCLFPFGAGAPGVVCGIVILVLMLYAGYVYHGKEIDKSSALVYIILGSIPYIRYLVLHNHANLHHFFTYRAQLVTVMAVWLILFDSTDINLFKRR